MKYKSELFNIITPIFVDNGKYFVNEMFNRKFNCDAPENTNHIIAFYKNTNNQYIPVSYVSFMPYKNVLLVGGAMTDGNAIRQMTEAEREYISTSEGIYFNMLKYAFAYFSDDCDAYFGYVNDPRALEVDIAAGFEETQYQYLVANYHKPISNWKKKRLTKMIHKLGAF